MFVLSITFLLSSLKTVELKLPTLRLAQPPKSKGYAALTNHPKQRSLSLFDKKSLDEDRLKNEAIDGKQKREVRSQAERSNRFSSEPLRHAVRSQLSEMRS